MRCVLWAYLLMNQGNDSGNGRRLELIVEMRWRFWFWWNIARRFRSRDFRISVELCEASVPLWCILLSNYHHRDTENHRAGTEKSKLGHNTLIDTR
jgi:hypothetical protein